MCSFLRLSMCSRSYSTINNRKTRIDSGKILSLRLSSYKSTQKRPELHAARQSPSPVHKQEKIALASRRHGGEPSGICMSHAGCCFCVMLWAMVTS